MIYLLGSYTSSYYANQLTSNVPALTTMQGIQGSISNVSNTLTNAFSGLSQYTCSGCSGWDQFSNSVLWVADAIYDFIVLFIGSLLLLMILEIALVLFAVFVFMPSILLTMGAFGAILTMVYVPVDIILSVYALYLISSLWNRLIGGGK